MNFENVLESIAASAQQKAEQRDGDYIGADGLLYCGKCHTAKQAKIVLPSGKCLTPRCLCKCAAEERDKRQKEAKQAEWQIYINQRKRQLIRDDKLLQYTFEKDKRPDSNYSKMFRRYCEKWQQIKENNNGLILWGDTGGGKSFYAACIANRLIEQGVRAYATTEPNILNDMFSATDKGEYIAYVVSFPLLVIDDFGASRNTSYAHEQIFTLIDERYKRNMPTILTTNLTPQDFDKASSLEEKRIYERVKEMGTFIEIKGKNWRQEEAHNKAQLLKTVLTEGGHNGN